MCLGGGGCLGDRLVEVDKKASTTETDLLEAALESGADDVEGDGADEDGEGCSWRYCTFFAHPSYAFQENLIFCSYPPGHMAFVYCPPQELASLKKGLEDAGFHVGMVELVYHPKSLVELCSDEDGEKLATLLEALEDDPDVQNVSHSAGNA